MASESDRRIYNTKHKPAQLIACHGRRKYTINQELRIKIASAQGKPRGNVRNPNKQFANPVVKCKRQWGGGLERPKKEVIKQTVSSVCQPLQITNRVFGSI
jgi:hypothetical protein